MTRRSVTMSRRIVAAGRFAYRPAKVIRRDAKRRPPGQEGAVRNDDLYSWVTMPSSAAMNTKRPIIVVMQPPRPPAGAAGASGPDDPEVGGGAVSAGDPTGASGAELGVGGVVGLWSGAAEMPSFGG
jgi:hypothetical protein